MAVAGRPAVVFVLGGPGAGKGTQCKRIVKEFGFAHLSAGDLLRAERKRDNETGTLIANYIKEGKIVPVEITVKLLKAAMESNMKEGTDRFLVDGFPRNKDNLEGWTSVMQDFADVKFVLFLDCPETVMETRLLNRNEGRTDDNIESIKKRFRTYVSETKPIIDIFEKEGKVRRISSDQSIDEIFAEVSSAFAEFKRATTSEATSSPVLEGRDLKKEFNHWMSGALVSAGSAASQAEQGEAKAEESKEAAGKKKQQFCDQTAASQSELCKKGVKEVLFDPPNATWTVSAVSRFNLSGGFTILAVEKVESGPEVRHTAYVNGYGILEQWESPRLPPLVAPQTKEEEAAGCSVM